MCTYYCLGLPSEGDKKDLVKNLMNWVGALNSMTPRILLILPYK
jgi:hypothetical protein